VLLPAAVTYVRQITYLILALILASNIATSPDLYGTAVTVENRYLFGTGSRTLAFRYRRYGRPIAATAGIFVLQDPCCIHVRLQVYIE